MSQAADQQVTTEQAGVPEKEHYHEVDDVMAGFQPSQRLDHKFAVIEEQFRKSFDDRFKVQKPKKQFWEDESEMQRTSKILREAARGIGDGWQPIFIDLMAKFPPEVVQAERLNIEKQQPVIQSYTALTAWKELMGAKYTAILLVDVLRKHDMDDLADEVLNILDNFDAEVTDDKNNDKKGDKTDKDDKAKSDDKDKPGKGIQPKKFDPKAKQGILDSRRLLLLAKKVGEDWEPLGKALDIPAAEISEIREGEDGKTYQGAFKVLSAWRKTQPGIETEESTTILKAALEKVGKLHLLEELEMK